MGFVYQDLNYIMDQDFDVCLELIRDAFGIKQERRQWQLYCSAYPHYTKDNFMTFEQFYRKSNPVVSTKPKQQVIDEVTEMRKKYGW